MRTDGVNAWCLIVLASACATAREPAADGSKVSSPAAMQAASASSSAPWQRVAAEGEAISFEMPSAPAVKTEQDNTPGVAPTTRTSYVAQATGVRLLVLASGRERYEGMSEDEAFETLLAAMMMSQGEDASGGGDESAQDVGLPARGVRIEVESQDRVVLVRWYLAPARVYTVIAVVDTKEASGPANARRFLASVQRR